MNPLSPVSFLQKAGTSLLLSLSMMGSAFSGTAGVFYLGDAAAEGRAVTSEGGPRADSVATLTYLLHGGSALYTAPGAQTLRLREVNFFADTGGTLTPFVAKYNGGDTQVAASYEVLAIGETLTVTSTDSTMGSSPGDHLENREFLVGGEYPEIALNAGDKITVGWVQQGQIVYFKESATTADYIANGNALTGVAVGGAPSLDSNWAFDREMRFNIGVEIVGAPVPALNFSGVESSSITSDISSTYTGDARSDDLSENGTTSLLSATLSPSTTNDIGGLLPIDGSELNDGSADTDNGVFFQGTTHSYTVTLDTSVNNLGYEISQIQTFAGWKDITAASSLANQDYELLIATIDNPAFCSLGRVTFGSLAGSGSSASKVTINPLNGESVIGSGVTALRFEFDVPADHIYQEVDVIGSAVPLPPPPPEPLYDFGNIWFIGDSITQSNADGDGAGSPRKSLYDLLVADNVDFKYTGHFTANLDGLPSDDDFRYHSGVSGSCIGANTNGRTNMTSGIPTWWNQARLSAARPNAVLIMLGTNDINLDDNLAGAPDRMKLLVNTILSQVGPEDPTPAIFVAQIPPNTGSTAKRQLVVDFNNALPAMISTLQEEGKDVTLVDQWSRINANTGGLMRDTLHTNAAGNDILAEQWYKALHLRFAPAGYPAWQITHFGETNALGSAPDDDPDNDGQSNFHEFAFGSNPIETGNRAFPPKINQADFTITRRVAAASGLVYTLQQSSSLTEGSWQDIEDFSEIVIATSGDLETVTITKAEGNWTDDQTVFLRLKVGQGQ
ncbi:GDSL-type esterase/lipase family protein [Verrucomicrobiaceae bacterium 227]